MSLTWFDGNEYDWLFATDAAAGATAATGAAPPTLPKKVFHTLGVGLATGGDCIGIITGLLLNKFLGIELVDDFDLFEEDDAYDDFL